MGDAPNVVVVGGSGVGLIFDVEQAPERGESVLARGVSFVSGGKAANHASGIAYLGANATIITAVGDDAFKDVALETIREHGVDLSRVWTKPHDTTMVGSVVVNDDGDNWIVVSPNALASLSAEDIRACEPSIAAADVCLVSLEIPSRPAVEAMRIARRHGVRTILNPAPSPPLEDVEALLELADIATPNLSEARAMTGDDGGSPDVLAVALAMKGVETVVITLGADGVLLHEAGHAKHIPAPKVHHVMDTSGAGDAFNAAFSVALAAGTDLDRACELGCEAGARVVQAPGFFEALRTWDDWRGRYVDIASGRAPADR